MLFPVLVLMLLLLFGVMIELVVTVAFVLAGYKGLLELDEPVPAPFDKK
jgi:hypothetical protein